MRYVLSLIETITLTFLVIPYLGKLAYHSDTCSAVVEIQSLLLFAIQFAMLCSPPADLTRPYSDEMLTIFHLKTSFRIV